MKPFNLNRSDLYLLILLISASLLVALVSSWIMPPEKTGSFFEKPSSYYNRSYGTKAFYLALEDLGRPVRRLERSIDFYSLEGIDSLLILEPWKRLSEDERKCLREWVAEGNRLLYIPAEDGRDRDRDDLSQEEETFPTEDEEGLSPPNVKKELITIEIGRDEESTDPLLEGVSSLQFGDTVLSDTSDRSDPCESGLLEGSECQTILSSATTPLGIRARLEAGTILWFADSYPLSNVGLLEDQHVCFLANLIRELTDGSPDRVIAFDEFHQGFVDRDASPVAILKLTFGDWWGYGIAHAFLVGILALLVASKRFGKPLKTQLEQRRHQTEFVYAAGKLLRRGKGFSPVGETLANFYSERFCNLLHLAPTTEDRTLAREVLNRTQADIGEALNLLKGNSGNGTVNENQIFASCQILEKVLKQLNDGNGKSD